MPDYQHLFESAPDAYLVLKPDNDFTIIGVNDAFLDVTMTERADIVGQPLFTIFPQNPNDLRSQSVEVLRRSLQAAVSSREKQTLALHRYDIRRSRSQGGGFERRHWRINNVPVTSISGQVEYVVQRIEDATEQAKADEQRHQAEQEHKSLVAQAEAATREIISRDHELARTHAQLALNQQRLRETEVRLEAAANVGDIATWIWEPQTDRVFADDNLARWYHVSPDVAHGGSLASYLEAVHPDDVEAVRDTLQRSLSTDSSVHVEFRIRGEVTPWRWVAARARIERDAQNRPIRFVGVVLDISELRQTSHQLEVTQERLSLAAEAADIGSFSWSMPPGDIVSNAKCKEHFWLPPDAEVTPEKLYAAVHPEDREQAREAIDHAIAGHTSFDGEYRTVSAAGEVRCVRAKGRAYYDSKGNATRFDGITLDNTRQRRIEAELQGSEARYRLLVDSLKDYAVFMQDDDGNVTSWNPGAERLLGYSEEEILGHSARIFFTSEDQARGEPEREIHTAKTTGRAMDDRWHVRKDGTRFFVNGMMVALQDDGGQRIGLAKIMRDMTDRQIANAERERLLEGERSARAEAERTSRLKDEFLATLSHELRTPLNAILGWTQVLKEGVHDANELDQGLEVIDRNTRLQAQLIEDLLDMSRIVSGKIRLDFQTVDLAAIVMSAVETVRTTADAKKITLRPSIPAAGAYLIGDRHRLQQIVLNLLSNAIKFTPRNGRIEVVVEVTPAEATVMVSDSGVGIRRDFLPHVFERFRQADASTTRQHGGLGLGLSIVKQLVELHGGTAEAQSAGENKGATFRISIPRARTEARSEHQTRSSHAKSMFWWWTMNRIRPDW
jgi:PAS domain S-box-containing protein